MANFGHMKKSSVLAVLVVISGLALCAACYLPGLGGPLLLDDFPQLRPLFLLHDRGLSFLMQTVADSSSGPFGRPVAMLSFIANAIGSGANLWWWKLTNLAIHLLNGILAYWLALEIFAANDRQHPTTRHFSAAAIAILWLVHPLHVSTVLYTVQRMTELAALFVFAGLATYIHGRRAFHTKPRKTWWLIPCAVGILFPLGVLSKETALLFPLFLLLIEIFIFSDARSIARGRLPPFLFLGVGAIVLLGVLGAPYLTKVAASYEARDFTLNERLLTEARVVMLYLAMIVVPIQSFMGFFHDDLDVSKGLFLPPSTALSIMALATLAFVAWRLRRRSPLFTFGVFFFLAGHLLESTIFPLELMFEHRNYLPSFGIILAIVPAIERGITSANLRWGLAISGTLILSATLFLRTDVWSSADRLYADAYLAHPNSEGLIAIYASKYAAQGDMEYALELLRKQHNPGYTTQRFVLQCQHSRKLDAKDLEEARTFGRLPVQSYELTGLIELSNLALDKKCDIPLNSLIEILDLALKRRAIGGAHPKLAIYKAHLLYATSNYDAAISTLESAASLDPNEPLPLFLATHWMIEHHDIARARATFQRARQVASTNEIKYRDYIVDIEQEFRKSQLSNDK